MRPQVLFALICSAFALLSCKDGSTEPTNPSGSSIRGIVRRIDDLSPLSNVVVYDVRGTARDTSKADGSFRLSYFVDGTYNGTIVAQKGGFYNDTIGFALRPDANDTLSRAFKLRPSPSFNMVYVQGGTFQMGSVNGSSSELPIHSVTLSSFTILQTEVNQKLWRDVVQWAQQHGSRALNADPSYFKGDSLPVEQVSWADVNLWLQHLNAKEGTTKYRLPTEAEWEYAARGGITSRGYEYSGSNTVDVVAWYFSNSSYTTHAAGTKDANELGLYNMSGNVWEWCSDWFGAYSSSPQTNPTGPEGGFYRVLRGGSWRITENACRVASRSHNLPPVYLLYDIGFRFVREL